MSTELLYAADALYVAKSSVSAVANKKRRTYTRKKGRVDDSDGETERCD